MMQRLEAMVWALDRINNSPNLLPNITLGILYPKFLTKKLLFNHVTSWSKFSYRILTILKLKLPNLEQTPGSKCWPIFSKEISTKHQPQNLDQTVVDPFLNFNISNTNNIKKFWVGIFKGQGHISQVYYTAVTDIHLALFSTFIQKVLLGKCYWSKFALFFTWGYFFEKNGMTSRTSSRGYI